MQESQRSLVWLKPVPHKNVILGSNPSVGTILTSILILLSLTGCDNGSNVVTVRQASKLEDKVDAIGHDKARLYVCIDKNDTYKDFKDCLRRSNP